MRKPALAFTVLAAASCGEVLPDFNLPAPAVESGAPDARGDDAPPVRILSDVGPPPREVEAKAPPAPAKDASPRARDAQREATTDASIDATDANVDGNEASLEERAPAIAADHLLLSEVVTRPSGAEMIEIFNPTPAAVDLSDYLVSDSHLYYQIAAESFPTASGSDFAARFPQGSVLAPGAYVVVAIGNASGGSVSFESTYGKKPDFELRPAANGAADDPEVPNMIPAQSSGSIGATASLTDAGEPVILFWYREGDRVLDVDYVYVGAPSPSNPVVDKTGVVVGGSAYHDDTPAASQHPAPAPTEGGALHRCITSEPLEARTGGNGLTGHDESSEDANLAFVSSTGAGATARTPGGPPPAALCAN